MRLVVDARDQGLPAEVGVDRLGELLADKSNRLWLDISDPGPEEVALLRREFGFHELALEDVTRPHERPRCDAYGGYYFIVVYAAEHTGTEFLPRELNLFWGENYLVTIHRGAAAVLAVLEEARRRWEQHEERHAHGVACLAYTLFDSLVDGYFAVQDRVRERIEGIEEAIFTGPRARRPTSSGSGKSCCGCRASWRRRATCWPRCSAATGRSRTSSDPTSRTCRTTRLHVLAELDTYRDLLGRRARRARLLRLQPAGPHHEAAHRRDRHHHGAELRRQHLRDELRAPVSTERVAVRLCRRCRIPGVHGGLGLHPFPSPWLALNADSARRSVAPGPNDVRDDSVAHRGVDCARLVPTRARRRDVRVEVHHPGRVRRRVQVQV